MSLDGSPYSRTTICASANVAAQRCLPLPLSPCPSVYPLLLVSCVACVCSGVSLQVSPSPHTSAPRLPVRIFAPVDASVLYMHLPVSTVHGMYGTCERTYLGVLCLFSWVCVSLVNIHKPSLFCVLVAVCVSICIAFCVPRVPVADSSLWNRVCDGAAVSC